MMTLTDMVSSGNNAVHGERDKNLVAFSKNRIAFNKALSDWCLRNAARFIDWQGLEKSLYWPAAV